MNRIAALTLWLLILPPAVATSEVPEGILALTPRPAPPLEVRDLDGQPFDLRRTRGQWRFVHFWASWCGPCRREMPAIERMARRMEGTSLRLVIVNTAEDVDTIWTFLAGIAPQLSSFMDRNGLATEEWSPRGLPATYLVDPEGHLRYQALGGRPWDEPPYLEFLRRLLQD